MNKINTDKILPPIMYQHRKRAMSVDLAKLDESLFGVQRGIAKPNSRINRRITGTIKMPLSDLEYRNYNYAYEYLNIIIKNPYLKPKDILDLNDICMCGISFGSAKESKEIGLLMDYHEIKQSYQQKFYNHIRPTWEWFSAQAQDTDLSPFVLAAGLYTKIVNDSKLFTDGHQRTGMLLMSYVLAKAGIEPFYLSASTAAKFFNISNAIKSCGSIYPIKRITLNKNIDKLVKLLEANCKQPHHRFEHSI